MTIELEPLLSADDEQATDKKNSKTLKVITWFSVGLAVAAVGLYVGAEIRSRYKFKKRTPYDFYSNAGEERASEFGMGI